MVSISLVDINHWRKLIMKNVTSKALLLVSIALISASASASLADRKSDVDDHGEAVSSPYSGQKVIRGQVVLK